MSDTSIFKFINVGVEFDGRKIINNFNSIIYDKQKAVITGSSGKGKSTLLKCLLGFAFPTMGNIEYKSNSISLKNIQQIRMEIAWIPQEITFFGNTVKDFIQFPFQFKSNANLKPSINEINVLLDKYYLNSQILKQNFNSISGGEKQRIALLISILLKRKIIIADEPTSALDIESKKIVIKELLENKNLTVLSVSHDHDWNKENEHIIEL